MSSVEFWLVLFTGNLPFWACWIVYDKTFVNPKKFDLTRPQNKEFFYKINSVPYKTHKRRWKKYYFLPILVYWILSITVAWLSSFRYPKLIWMIGFAAAFLAVNIVEMKEQPEARQMEKEVAKQYAAEQLKLYNQMHKKEE